MFYFTYVLKSSKNNSLYIGWTTDLKQRLSKHNKGKIRSTKSGVPWKLVYYEARVKKQKAILREKALKTGFGRKFVNNNL